jgi:hypothetical protein
MPPAPITTTASVILCVLPMLAVDADDDGIVIATGQNRDGDLLV